MIMCALLIPQQTVADWEVVEPIATTTVEIVTPKLSNKYGTEYTESEIQNIVNVAAQKYNVSSHKMMVTLKCETRYINKQSDIVSKGVRENSWGIAQINLTWHPEVTKSEALDPYYSVEFMARRFSEGYASEWSCYRKFF